VPDCAMDLFFTYTYRGNDTSVVLINIDVEKLWARFPALKVIFMGSIFTISLP
jgi:hypothetical protein